MGPAGSQEIDGFHRAQGDDPGVAAAVADHADGLHRLEDDEGLADLVVPVGLAQFTDEDVVGAAQQSAYSFFTSPRMRTPRPRPGSGKGWR